MRIEFENTLEDKIAFLQHIYKTSPSMKRRRLMLIYLFPILWFIILVLPSISSKEIYVEIIIWFVISIVWMIFIPYLYKRGLIRNARKLYSEGENKGAIGKHIIEVNPEYIEDITDFGEYKIKWNAINKVETDNSHIYIFISSVAAHVIPKKYFNSNSEVENFLNEIQNHINKKKV